MAMVKRIVFFTGMVYFCCSGCIVPSLWSDFSKLDALIGYRDAVLVMSGTDLCIYEKNADVPLIPASTLKVLTALAAFQYLGEDYSFKTEFYLDNHHNLTIKGYGDPLLISENISHCCDKISTLIRSRTKVLKDIRLDDSYFSDISVPGATDNSTEPYDSVNGALCANFNTVFFKQNGSGQLISAESQTPLLPFAKNRIASSGLKQGRILLTKDESKRYAGHLFKYFLEQKGISVSGRIISAQSQPLPDDLIYSYKSLFSLRDVVSQLLEYSNNFIANQLCLIIGAELFGTPASLEKGVAGLQKYIESQPSLTQITLVEGSGLSRQNRITARNMDQLLKLFEPYRMLMKENDRTYYKTGTLKGISTRVGYIKISDESVYRFVVFCNSPEKSSEKITRRLLNSITVQKLND